MPRKATKSRRPKKTPQIPNVIRVVHELTPQAEGALTVGAQGPAEEQIISDMALAIHLERGVEVSEAIKSAIAIWEGSTKYVDDKADEYSRQQDDAKLKAAVEEIKPKENR